MSRFGIGEIVVVLVIIILLFGAKKLPALGKAFGDAIREFKKSKKDKNNPTG